MLDNQNQLVDGIQINSQFAKGPFLIDGKDTVSSLFLKRCIEFGKRTLGVIFMRM